MFYISSTQFEDIKKFFKVKQIEDYTEQFIISLYNKYKFDKIFQVHHLTEIISYVLVFEFDNVKIYANIFLRDCYKNILNIFYKGSSFILNKHELEIVFNDADSAKNYFINLLFELERKCKNYSTKYKTVSCGEICNIGIFSDVEISQTLINEYLYSEFNCRATKEQKIYSCGQTEIYNQIQSVFNTIQFFYQLRTVNRAKILSEGNGYTFFEIKEYIVGFQKYYNYLDSPLTYYLINRKQREVFVFALKKSVRQVLRLGQSILANKNIDSGGINLHASAAVFNNNAIILTGNKESGKTTNLLFGLKYVENLKIMSNDIVYLFYKNSKIYALGSPRKMTVRAGTVELFDEFVSIKSTEYDSVGNSNSNNTQLVKNLDDIANAFNTDVQYCAPIGLIVFAEYENNLRETVLEIINYEEAVEMLAKQEHSFYNGREMFWDDIFECNFCCDFSMLKKICFIKVKVSKENIYKTWNELIDHMGKMGGI